MCGRYVLARATDDLAADLGAEVPDGVEFRQSWNIAPTATVPILVEHPSADETTTELAESAEPVGERGGVSWVVHPARWGLLPFWAKSRQQSYKTFNARSESVVEKPTFRSAVRSKRCAVPADAYFEWLKGGEVKRPHVIRPADGSLITFAGLYEWWKDPELEAAGESSPWVLSCTILTGPSPEPGAGGVLGELAGLHDRIPLPLGEDMRRSWVAGEKLEKPAAAELVEEVRGQALEVASGWEVYEVSREVGNVRNNGPELLQPV